MNLPKDNFTIAGITPDNSKAVQKILVREGFLWADGQKTIDTPNDVKIFLIYHSSIHYSSDTRASHGTVISVSQLLRTTIRQYVNNLFKKL